jgi:hypothetical protein
VFDGHCSPGCPCDQLSGVASGTYHGRFLILDEYVGKRITIEVEE